MSSTAFSPHWSPSSPTSLPTVSIISTPLPVRDMEADIKKFWAAFPCPPPWKPRLLVEVNTSRLDPQVSRTVKSFLADKCDIEHVMTGYDLGPHPDLKDQGLGYDLDTLSTDSPDPGSSLGGPSTSEHQWCDAMCQVSIGCAIFFVVVAMMVAVLVCVTRQRVRHKMASARPSRQQLQLSTSTSDAVNCTEFSNLEIQGDDDFIYPPFRHRGLPLPPTSCHPSCDPKWNCANCSSCHPLMRMSPSGQYYSRAYSAVYETIDDDDDDTQRSGSETYRHARGANPLKNDSRGLYHSCGPCQMSPSSVSTVQFRPCAMDDARDHQQMAETGFNGEEASENTTRSPFPPKYFELDHNCALSGHHSHDPIPHNRQPCGLSTFHVPTSGECYNLGYTSPGPGPGPSPQPQVSLPPCQYPHLVDTPLHSFVLSQAQHSAMPSASELYQHRQASEAAPTDHQEGASVNDPGLTSGQSTHSYPRTTEGVNVTYHNQANGYTYDPNVPNVQFFLDGRGLGHVNQPSATPSYLVDVPNHYFCPSCQHGNVFANQQRDLVSPHHMMEGQNIQDSSIGPDLLNEASNASRRADMEQDTPSMSNEAASDNNEVPLRKPVLALHSQYFAKTSAA